MRLLIVDDEINIRKVLQMVFQKDGYEVCTAADGRDAIKILQRGEHFDCIISDLKMQHTNGMELLQYVRQHGFSAPFIFITAYGSIPDAVKAIKSGASDFISKPFNKNVLRHLVMSLINEEKDRQKNLEALQSSSENQATNSSRTGILYASPEMKDVLNKARKVAKTKLSVCIQGESGVGKERIAKAIHYYQNENTSEQDLPFVSVNCPAIPESLIESELFGYKKGAFTGATKDFDGKVKRAGSGTLFLDEIGDMPMSTQPKLLRLLEDGYYEPLGANESQFSDARIICASNIDLEKAVQDNLFREDLYYRVSTIKISVPPLRDRIKDILVLSQHFLDQFCVEHELNPKQLSSETLELLCAYKWPGNVRELKNTIQSAAALSDSGLIYPEDMPERLRSTQTVISKTETDPEQKDLAEVEVTHIKEALDRAGGNISGAARILGISRGSLRYKMKKYNI